MKERERWGGGEKETASDVTECACVFMYFSFYLLVSPSVCLCFHSKTCPFREREKDVGLSVCTNVCVCVFLCLSVYLSARLSVCPVILKLARSRG